MVAPPGAALRTDRTQSVMTRSPYRRLREPCPLSLTLVRQMCTYYIHYMSEPVVESMAEVRRHLADVIDRARRDGIPTIITRRGKSEAVLADIDEYRRLKQVAEQYEEEWLNRLADEAESEGLNGSVSVEEMAALLRSAP